MASSPRYPVTLTYYAPNAPGVDFSFDAEDLGDIYEKAVAKYEFPYMDGALLEDMGQRAHVVRIRAFFFNETYELHKSLINLLQTVDGDSWALVHPAYGTLKGRIEFFSPRHDPRIQTAEVDIAFIEQLKGTVNPLYNSAVDQAVAGRYPKASAALVAKLASDPMAFLKNFQKQAAAYTGMLNAQLRQITNPANSVIAMTSFATSLPGQTVGSVAQCVERYALSFSGFLSSPSKFMASFSSAIDDLAAAFGDFAPYTYAEGAAQGAMALSSALAADADTETVLEQAASAPTFDATGRLLKDPSSPDLPLTVGEIEDALAACNTLTQTAVSLNRDLLDLKAMTGDLTDYVARVKKGRDRTITVNVGTPVPLHLVCLQYGLPYGYAEAVLGLNDIRNPNFTSGPVTIYAA